MSIILGSKVRCTILSVSFIHVGSMLPVHGSPVFSQLYFSDNAMEVRSGNEGLRREVLEKVNAILAVNPFKQQFENAAANIDNIVGIRIAERLEDDRRRYNAPTGDEIGALLPTSNVDSSRRDIIIRKRDRSLLRYLIFI